METYYFTGSGDPIGLVFRYSDSGFYLLKLFPSGVGGTSGKAVLYKSNGGLLTTIASSNTFEGYRFGAWQLLQVIANGPGITVDVDGKTIISTQDSTYSSGGLGFYAAADGSAAFDNLRVEGVNTPQ